MLFFFNETKISSNTLDKNFKSKGKRYLNEFKKVLITKMIIDKYKEKYKGLKHIRINKNTKGYIFLDNTNIVALVMTEKKPDNNIWIQALEVSSKYKGYGLGNQLLKFAISMKATYLSVNKKNKIAYEMYKKSGFKVYKETESMYFMKK